MWKNEHKWAIWTYNEKYVDNHKKIPDVNSLKILEKYNTTIEMMRYVNDLPPPSHTAYETNLCIFQHSDINPLDSLKYSNGGQWTFLFPNINTLDNVWIRLYLDLATGVLDPNFEVICIKYAHSFINTRFSILTKHRLHTEFIMQIGAQIRNRLDYSVKIIYHDYCDTSRRILYEI